MSRIGKAPIAIPAGVKVTVDEKTNVVTVEGKNGKLSQAVHPDLKVTVEDNHVYVTRPSDDREHRAQHGLFRALIHNMVEGVHQPYRKEMELVGVGYRATATGQVLELSLGYSHAIYIKLLESSDKQLLGQVCAKIRSMRKPEPYKGKGIKFVGEVIRRKSGKKAGAK